MTPHLDSEFVTARERVAVVTGASSGIGADTVRRLRAAGWIVLAAARRADALDALAAETGCATAVVDVTRPDDVAALAAAAADLGDVGVLVNNAGIAIGMDSVESAGVDDWRTMFEVNVLGVLRVTQAILPLLRAGVRGRETASIVTVTSTAAQLAYEGGGGYAAAKHAAHALVATLRLELAGEPIKVVEVAPGMVHTPEFSVKRFGGDADAAASIYRDVDRPLTADDVAEQIVHAIELPAHVNLDVITMRPVAQAAQHKVARGPLTPRG